MNKGQNRDSIVIAGGGLTAARAIKSYREAGGEGAITLVSEEPTLPYHRPALSKGYLRGETTETPHVEDEAFYRDHDVDVQLETRVLTVDPAAQAVTVESGAPLRYDKLLLATGATPRRQTRSESRAPPPERKRSNSRRESPRRVRRRAARALRANG